MPRDPSNTHRAFEQALRARPADPLLLEIEVRQHLREKKDFQSADLIRDLLAERKITLEDRPDGTIWRAE